MKYLLIGFMVCAGSGVIQPAMAESRNVVVLLHGLARSSTCMNKLENALQNKGFITCNIDYPSTKYPVEILAQEHILPKIADCVGSLDVPISFVTHSMADMGLTSKDRPTLRKPWNKSLFRKNGNIAILPKYL